MKIEHIAIYVTDLEKAGTFFMKYFGAKSDDGVQLEIMNNPKMSDLPKRLVCTGYAHILPVLEVKKN